MKKLSLLLLFCSIFNAHNFVNAQSLSIEETKKILTSYKWVITRTESEGERSKVEKELEGMKWVFKTDGTVVNYLPSQKESERTPGKWTITKSQIDIKGELDEAQFIYRLENASVYYLYLKDKDEDWITYVFKQAEKIDYTKITRTEPDRSAVTSGGFQSMNTQNKKTAAYTSGEKLGTQKWKRSKTFPVEKINADWKEDYYITDISYGRIGIDKEWFVTSSKTKFTTQLWKLKSNTDELKAAIEEIRKTRPEHYISHIAYGDNQWVMVASKGTGYANQTTIMSRKFPEENIKENWKTDYYITDMAYGGGWWTVVMSKGSTITKQHFHTWDLWDQDKIDNEIDKGDYLTEAVKQGEKWYMAFSGTGQ